MKIDNPSTKYHFSKLKKSDLSSYLKLLQWSGRTADDIAESHKAAIAFTKFTTDGRPIISTEGDLLGYLSHHGATCVEEAGEYFHFNVTKSFNFEVTPEIDGLNVYAFHEYHSGAFEYKVFVEKELWRNCLALDLIKIWEFEHSKNDWEDSDEKFYCITDEGREKAVRALKEGNLFGGTYFEYCRICFDAKKPFWRSEKMVILLSLLGFTFVKFEEVWAQDVYVSNVKHLLFLVKKFLPPKCEFSPRFFFCDQEPLGVPSGESIVRESFSFIKEMSLNVPNGIRIYCHYQCNDVFGEMVEDEYVDNADSRLDNNFDSQF